VVVDAVLIGERGLSVLAVIADREDLDAGAREFVFLLLQLDELRSAERSPAHRTMEDDQRLLARSRGREVGGFATLVDQREVRHRLADGGPAREVVRLRHAPARRRWLWLLRHAILLVTILALRRFTIWKRCYV